MIDFHTHSLPNIDDGSDSKEESLLMLKKQQEQGVKKVVFTPHFYPNKDLEIFLAEREDAFRQLGELELACYKGAEVLLSTETPSLANLKALAIEGTPYILVELPFAHWPEWVFIALQEVIDNHGLIPIIAHIEMYEEVYQNLGVINKLIEIGVLIQINTESCLSKGQRKALLRKLFKKKLVHVIGSDVHHIGAMHTVNEAYHVIEKEYGKATVTELQQLGEEIISGKRCTARGAKPFKKVFGKWY